MTSYQGGLAHRNRGDFFRFAIAMPIARQETAMLHCDLRVPWKVASDLRFRAAISEPKTPCFCGISGDLAPSTRKSLAIAIVRFGALSRVVTIRFSLDVSCMERFEQFRFSVRMAPARKASSCIVER